MVMLPRIALAAALFGAVSADFAITSPGPDHWWVAKSQNVIEWSCHDNPPHDSFTILVANKDPKVLTAPIAILGVQNNFDCSKIITPDQVNEPVGTGYTIQFANILNQSDVFATSQEFEIKPLGAAYPAQSTTTSSSGSSTGSAAGSTTTNTTTAKPNSAGSLGVSFGLAAIGAALGLAGF